MLQGEALYRQLEASHPLLSGLPAPGLPVSGAACFETFPHAIAWHLRGGQASAAHQLASGRPCRAYGEAGSGLIVVPQGPSTVEPPH